MFKNRLCNFNIYLNLYVNCIVFKLLFWTMQYQLSQNIIWYDKKSVVVWALTKMSFETLRKFASNNPEKVILDNMVFKLHYKATVILLLGSCLLITSNQFFGGHLDCLVDGVPTKIVNTYCLLHGTYTIRCQGQVSLSWKLTFRIFVFYPGQKTNTKRRSILQSFGSSRNIAPWNRRRDRKT